MRSIIVYLALVFALVAGPATTRAARDAALPQRADTTLELLVFEKADCYYCQAFRATIAERYAETPNAARAPMRYVDIDKADLEKIGLSGQITVLPTVVIMKRGREADRITGLFGPENFMRMIAWALERHE